MATIDVVSVAGKKVGTRDLAPEVFEATVSVPLMHQVVLAGLRLDPPRHALDQDARRGLAAAVSKPWRQKGTGRARQGSNRSPQWTGGGVVHGPHPRDHEMRVNKKMKRGALRSALTDALTSGKLAVVQDLAFDEPKTKTGGRGARRARARGQGPARAAAAQRFGRGGEVVPQPPRRPGRLRAEPRRLRGDRARTTW